MWTLFYDLHSGGGAKTDWEIIIIETDSEQAAIDYFKERFEQDPNDIACYCCGENFSIHTFATLEETESWCEYSTPNNILVILKDEQLRMISNG